MKQWTLKTGETWISVIIKICKKKSAIPKSVKSRGYYKENLGKLYDVDPCISNNLLIANTDNTCLFITKERIP